MPAVAKTSDSAIAEAARLLVERGDPEFSMAAVAEAVGVRTPSLYKRYADRDALLARVRRDAYDALCDALIAARTGHEGAAALRAMAFAYRAFAIDHPRIYALFFSANERSDDATQGARAAAVAPVLDVLRPMVPGAHLLDTARALTAFLHGHVSMEVAGAFHLGGDIAAAFVYGLELLIAGIADAGRTRTTRRVPPNRAAMNP